MAISETKMQMVIANYFKDECDVNTSIRQAFEKGFRIGVKKGASTNRPQGEYTTEEVAEILATAFGDECACNYNGIDEWLPLICKYVATGDCPHPKDKHGCWIQYLVQYGARMKGADDEQVL